ncbi:MAG: putative PEP-binding protein, partial [Brooklawnia sp.]
LDVATAVRLDPRTCLGVITLAGGSSGHGMLAAQARGIPILTGRPDAEKIPDGALVAFDPVTRELWLDVTPELRAEFDQRNHARVADAEQARSRAHEPALTTGGRRILVEANVGSLADAIVAAREGAEGSGVVRTEVLFGASPTAPTIEEQTDLLVRVGHAIGGPITVRSWDPAGDKPMAFLPHAVEDNPALGERGIRLMRRLPELFADQMRAVLLASRQVEVRLMLPMVTVCDEVVWARSIFEQVRAELDAPPIPLGMMVEVPAAAIRAADFAGLVDFVSIGTNDLSQYTQAADRTNGTVRDLARQDAPAVLDLVRATCEGLHGVPIAVCGDLASDPSATATLIGFGVTELSVRPRMVAEIKQAVRLV